MTIAYYAIMAISLGVFGASLAGLLWARSADDLVKGPFSFVFAGLTVLASIVVVVIALQMEDAERCAKRTVAGLLHHQTFTTFDSRP